MSDDPPDDYLRALVLLNDACVSWFKERAPQFGFLKVKIPELKKHLPIVTGPLSAAAVHWSGNEAAFDFFEYIDRKTLHRCSLLQFQILSLLQYVNSEPVNSEPSALGRN
jgi:hypothetical protein